uniref:DUF642 domain-containing protein n=1 Tax=Oryza barthii TaxID=65489 RepID=A0A0D3FI14_9ORYZ
MTGFRCSQPCADVPVPVQRVSSRIRAAFLAKLADDLGVVLRAMLAKKEELATVGNNGGWDSYSWAFKAKHSVVLFIVHNPGVSDDEACGPLIDSFAIKTLQPPQRTKGNMLKNGGFEEGPYIFPNTSWGVLVPPMDEDDYTPLSPWTILSTTKSVKYIDAAHYAVPGGARAVELVSGMETAMVQEVSTVPGRSYRLEFSVGDAGDGCSGSLTVQAYACGDERGGREAPARRREEDGRRCWPAAVPCGRPSAEEKTDAGTTATAVRSVDGRTTIAAASGGVAAMGNPTAAAITQVLHNKQEFRLTAGVDDLLVVSIGSGSSSAAPSATPSSRGLLLGPVGEADAELAAAQEVAVEVAASAAGRPDGWRGREKRGTPSMRRGHRAAAGPGRGGGGDEEDADNHHGNADDHHAHRPPRARTPPSPPAAARSCYSPAAKRSKKRREKKKRERER